MFVTLLSVLTTATIASASSALPANGPAAGKPVAAAAARTIRVPLPPPGRRLALPAIAGPADRRLPLVVIDPGHGGIDRGVAAGGEHDEPTLALGLARALRDELVARGRVRVALTRDADRLLTLAERARIAAGLKADLFVSIHLGAVTAPGEAGLIVYTRAEQASDAVGERTAAAENRVDRPRGKVLGPIPVAADGQAGPLTARQVSERSTVFANLVVRENRWRLPLNAVPRREAPFALLAAIAAPAVLVEAGSFGNPDQATRLASPGGRASFAKGLATAIDTYFSRLPPER